MLLFKALIALISSPLACVQLRGPGAVGCPQPGNQGELHPWGGIGGCGEKSITMLAWDEGSNSFNEPGVPRVLSSFARLLSPLITPQVHLWG